MALYGIISFDFFGFDLLTLHRRWKPFRDAGGCVTYRLGGASRRVQTMSKACPGRAVQFLHCRSVVFICSIIFHRWFPQISGRYFFVLFGFVCLLILRPLAGRKRTAVRPSAWHTHTHTRTCRPFTPTILGCPVSVEFKEASRNEFWSSITLSICISWVLD